MWDYSETVKDHFYNPRNAGALSEADATGEVGSLSCGDALRLQLKVNAKTQIIEEAGFQTFGCGSAIASSSALTEIVKGKTLDEALEVSNQDIADYLDGLPPEKMHCSVMGREALQAAIADYRGEEWKNTHTEGELVCKCFAIDAVLIEDTVRANGLRTVEDVTNYTKAGGGCSSCHEGIEEIISKVLAEQGQEFDPDVAPQPLSPEILAAQEAAAQLQQQRIAKIQEVIEEIRMVMLSDGGDIDLIDVQGRKVMVHLIGACSGCHMASQTLEGLQQQMTQALGEPIELIPVQAQESALSNMGS